MRCDTCGKSEGALERVCIWSHCTACGGLTCRPATVHGSCDRPRPFIYCAECTARRVAYQQQQLRRARAWQTSKEATD